MILWVKNKDKSADGFNLNINFGCTATYIFREYAIPPACFIFAAHKQTMQKLILASQSPRRKQLLEQAGLAFAIQAIPTDESFPDDIPPNQAAGFIATEKAKALWATLSEAAQEQNVVLAADTIVLLGNQILGKPADKMQAVDFLKHLSGNVHEVITGVCIIDEKRKKQFSVRTKVYFRTLNEEQINFYVDNFQPYDKAGAYAIQEWIGLIGIEKIEGDYYNVVGLPVGEVINNLQQYFPEVLK